MLTQPCKDVIMSTRLSKEEKNKIKDAQEGEVMSDKEWAKQQGMTYSELQQDAKEIRDAKKDL